MIKYEFSMAGARLAARDFWNLISGNNLVIREYCSILKVLEKAQESTKSRVKIKKYRSAYNRLSEQKVEKVSPNKFVFTWYLPENATIAQNRAKVLQGRQMLEKFGLSK
ncbi:MAG: hypothetical protein J6K82_00715 [Alphaproteobacteria bacterium]|nr:hypothetical protein [Alphaproteobacteria bacterium]